MFASAIVNLVVPSCLAALQVDGFAELHRTSTEPACWGVRSMVIETPNIMVASNVLLCVDAKELELLALAVAVD